MLDMMPKSDTLNELLSQLDVQHEELSQALDRGAISDARRLQAVIIDTAKLIDAHRPVTSPIGRRKNH